MKTHTTSLLLACTFLFASCGKKEKTTPSTDTAAAAQITEVAEAAEATEAAPPAADAATRAAHLGFVRYMPADTDGIFAFYDGRGLAKTAQGSQIGEFVESILEDTGMHLEDLINPEENPEGAMVATAFAEEFFISFGDSTGKQLSHIITANNFYSYITAKVAIKQFTQSLSGDTKNLNEDLSSTLLYALDDPKLGAMDIITDLNVPPITIGIKVSDKNMRDQFASMLSESLQQLSADEDLGAQALTLNKNDFQLTGVKLFGKKIVEMIDADPAERKVMEETYGEERFEKILKLLAQKNICITSGVKDDYLILATGGSEESIKFAENVNDSVATHADFAFMDHYINKKLNVLAYGEGTSFLAMEEAGKASYETYFLSLKDALAESPSFGDTSDIQAGCDKILGLLKKRFSKYASGSLGFVGFLEDGFKMEAHSKNSVPGIDFNHTHALSPLGESEDVFLFSNWTNDPETSAIDLEIIDTIGEITYSFAKKVSGIEDLSPEVESFTQGFAMFDQNFASDLLEVWKALRHDWAKGVGNEMAFIVDLNGGLPTIPLIPEVVVKNGKIPRLTLAAPVENRQELKKSWTRINNSLVKLFKTASEMSGQDIPMQEPIESTQDGQSTWFFTTIPCTTNDCMPNVTVSDDYFFASTSKSLATSLEDKIKAGGAPKRKGAYLKLNFNALENYLNHWIKLVEENPDEFFAMNPPAKDEFVNNLPMIKKAMEAFGELEDLSMHSRKNGSEYRTSLHFKTK